MPAASTRRHLLVNVIRNHLRTQHPGRGDGWAKILARWQSEAVDHNEQDVLAGVGPRLRALRRARGCSLTDLAAETGLTLSTLSRLENGKRRPTLEQLLPLARAYRIPLDDLVGAQHTGDPRIHLRPVTHRGMTFVPLTRNAGGIQAYKVIYPPASQWGSPAPRTHDGYEWFYVMGGHVDFLLGDRRIRMGPGEAAEFDTRIPHWIGSAAEQPAELLTLIGIQGERVHLAVSDD
jgi:transcriptional regulator with XRE-family HTH domain